MKGRLIILKTEQLYKIYICMQGVFVHLDLFGVQKVLLQNNGSPVGQIK
jgi:hypothetical protein